MSKSGGKPRSKCPKIISYAVVSGLSMTFMLVVKSCLDLFSQHNINNPVENYSPRSISTSMILRHYDVMRDVDRNIISPETSENARNSSSKVSRATVYLKNWTCYRSSHKKYVYLDWEYDGSEFSNINYRSIESLLGLYKDNDMAFRMLMIGPPMMEFYKIGNTLRYDYFLKVICKRENEN